MTDLTTPRVEVMAYYPQSTFEIGEILEFASLNKNNSAFDFYQSVSQENNCEYAAEVDKCPAIFRKMQWWEKRELSDMPQYVKSTHTSGVYKVQKWISFPLRAKLISASDRMKLIDMLPATQQEYEAYLKQTQK